MFGIKKDIRLHFIGVGGIGMSGIAEVLINLGYKVSGSDLNHSPVIERLVRKGLVFFKGHHKDNVQQADLVIYSSAVGPNNSEYQAAEESNIPLIKRAEMLAELMRLKFGIAVAGSHGKTTTTSILATILSGLDLSPTYVIGGVVKNLGSNAGLGKGDVLVAEADESDGSFHYLNPIITILTNIDNDHLDHYGSLESLTQSFINFVNKIPFYGKMILNIDDKTIRERSDDFKRKFITFSLEDESSDYFIHGIKVEDALTYFSLKHDGESFEFHFPMAGYHNIQNCAAAIIAAKELGHLNKNIQNALKSFEGVSRRLEVIGQKCESIFIDDYAHHPTEIDKTIEAVEKSYSDYELNVIFEPHRFTRTQNFWDDFIRVLSKDCKVSILPIYPAGEPEVPYIDSEIMVKKLKEKNKKVEYLSEIEKLNIQCDSKKRIYLFLGAGPISRKSKELVKEHYS